MLLMIEALLLISAAVGEDLRAAAAVKGQIFPLDMAVNSVDDDFKGCRENMANLVKTEYLQKELNNSAEFNKAWKKGLEHGQKDYSKDNLTSNHSVAIYVYTDDMVFRDFNNDTRYGKQNYTNKTYKWYSLHFLLADAIQILKKTQKGCMTTYRRTNVKFNENVLNTTVRFGSFASSSLHSNKTIFGNVSCFNISTCYGAEVTKYSKLPREREWLIPPYEMFNVIDVKTRRDQKDLWCDTVFVLNSTGTQNDLNCALFRGPSPKISIMFGMEQMF
ncbi:T-cell ecto-ADP-ribosyltransferase 2-like [Ctenopharyngodon idella]|uniref:T-cell ecto-ADP-ribosyltransferase 2-like n=1 Tax=Ctenopharyngodon idella TaxID=7959 RepID=UPI002230FABE|nr:T-cell ecto-ADP-ribosyltransferase 2-like [Ctenopharyngodon idella]